MPFGPRALPCLQLPPPPLAYPSSRPHPPPRRPREEGRSVRTARAGHGTKGLPRCGAPSGASLPVHAGRSAPREHRPFSAASSTWGQVSAPGRGGTHIATQPRAHETWKREPSARLFPVAKKTRSRFSTIPAPKAPGMKQGRSSSGVAESTNQCSRRPIGVGVGREKCGRLRDRSRRVHRRRWRRCRPRGPRHLVYLSINTSCPPLLTRF